MTTAVRVWAQTGRYATWCGHRIFFREDGAGDPLLLLHGMPTASWVWHRVWPVLVARYRVLAPDFIGFGLSDKPRDFHYSIARQADLCLDLLAERHVDRVHVLSHDYGNTIAQEMLARPQGSVIASLCCLNGGIFPEAHHPLLMQRVIASRLGRPLARLVIRRPFQRNLARLFGPDTQPDQATLDTFWNLLTGNNGRAVLPRLLNYLADRQRHRDRLVEALVRAPVPRCFLCGMSDPVCNTDMMDRWRELIPDGEVIELPRIGHWPQLETPDAVVAAYRRFREVA